MQEKLKPCPFCGGKAELDFAHSTFSYFCVDGTKKDSGFFYVVKCTTCNCKSGIFEDPTMAMETWDKRASTIEPQCKKGKWKQVHVGGFTPGGNSLSVCSECGWEFGTHMIYPDYNFCPSCGADMRKEVNE